MRKTLRASLMVGALLAGSLGSAQESENGCPNGSFAVVSSPDGTVVSLLFDEFTVVSGDGSVAEAGLRRKHCSLVVPLRLPEGYSLGVYRIDYRGFADLSAGQNTVLTVDYELGRRSGRGRVFRRQVHGAYQGDFIFTERLGAGIMRRVGCGEAAVLNVNIDLALRTRNRAEPAMAALDTVDGAPQGGLIYRFDLKRCPR